MTTETTQQPATPVRIERLLDQRSVKVTWDDQREDVLPFDFLRGYCPCAGCQGHLVRTVKFRPPSRAVNVDAIVPVGNYAISIRFSDGHTTGIYRFDFLRRIGSIDPEATGPAEP